MSKTLLIVGIACLAVQLAIGQSFQDQCVNSHNKYRKMHGVPNVTNDPAISKFAQEWANNLANNNKFEHRPNNNYGENIYGMYGSTQVTCDMSVTAWYNEIKDYNWNSPGFSLKTGHFTQVIWKNSKKIGCASATKGTTVIVVCNYDPPGNYEGQYPANVPKKK